jgi:F-type H+-transporting ATPase subunit delta
MSDESIARRYAAALFGLAQKTGTVNTVDTDLTMVTDAYRTARQFRAILSDPNLAEGIKKTALNGVFKSRVSPTTLTFLNLLIDKRRVTLLPEIQQEFDRLALEVQNVARATAITAVALKPAEVKSLTTSLEARTGKKIELVTEVDPAVLGGVLVRIGDNVIDGTVRGNLERLRARLLAK